MKSKGLGLIGRCVLLIPTLAMLDGCGTSSTTERMNEQIAEEKLGKVEQVEESESGKENIVATIVVTERIVIDTAHALGSASPADSIRSFDNLSLDIYRKDIPDTSEHASFRFHVRNSSDSLAVIDRVEPSCGCIMATVQKSFAGQGREGEVYVGLVVSRMSDIQPYTIDVYTTLNPDKPLRLTIQKVHHTGNGDR